MPPVTPSSSRTLPSLRNGRRERKVESSGFPRRSSSVGTWLSRNVFQATRRNFSVEGILFARRLIQSPSHPAITAIAL